MNILHAKIINLQGGKGLYVTLGRAGEDPCEFVHFRLLPRETASDGVKRVLGIDWIAPPTRH